MSWTSTRNNAVYRTADVRRKLADRGIALPEGAAAAAANLDRIRATRPVQPEPNAVRDAILNDAEPAEIDRLLLAELAAARRLAAHNQAEIDAATRTLRQIRDGHNEIYPQLKQRADEAIAHIDAVAGLDGASLDALVRDGRHDDAKLLVNVTAAAAELQVLYELYAGYLADGGYQGMAPEGVNCSRWRDPRPVERHHRGDETVAEVFVHGVRCCGQLWYPTQAEAIAAAAPIAAEVRKAAAAVAETRSTQGGIAAFY